MMEAAQYMARAMPGGPARIRLTQALDEDTATPGNGTRVALTAQDRAQNDQQYKANRRPHQLRLF